MLKYVLGLALYAHQSHAQMLKINFLAKHKVTLSYSIFLALIQVQLITKRQILFNLLNAIGMGNHAYNGQNALIFHSKIIEKGKVVRVTVVLQMVPPNVKIVDKLTYILNAQTSKLLQFALSTLLKIVIVIGIHHALKLKKMLTVHFYHNCYATVDAFGTLAVALSSIVQR